MKKSIQFSLMMILMFVGTYHVNAQEFNKKHLVQISEKYGLDLEGVNGSNQKAYVVQVDSMISTYPESDFEKAKEIKSYYENGKLHMHTYLYLINNEWEISNRYVNNYNDDGKILERLYESWEEGQWLASSKSTYTYFDFGEVQNRLTERFQNDAWVNDRLSSYAWDSNHNFAELLSQKWEDNEWINRFIINTTNNENGWYLVDIVKLWEDNEWVNSDSTLYGYDDGNNTFIDTKLWLDDEWVNGRYSEYRYDSEQRQTSHSSSLWSENEYMKSRMDSTTYNEDGLEDTKLVLIGNDANEWEYTELEQRIYDENLNLIEQTIQLWNNDQWNNGFMGEYVFGEGSVAGIMSEWIDNDWEPSTQFGYLYYILEGEQIYRGYGENSLHLYYSDVQVGIDKPSINQSHLEAYPNPTTGLYHIKMLDDNIKTIDVYQLNSQLGASYKLNGSQEFQLDLSDMPNGIYMIKVQSEKHTIILKTVKSN